MIEFWAIKLTLPCCASLQEENLAARVRGHDEGSDSGCLRDIEGSVARLTDP